MNRVIKGKKNDKIFCSCKKPDIGFSMKVLVTYCKKCHRFVVERGGKYHRRITKQALTRV